MNIRIPELIAAIGLAGCVVSGGDAKQSMAPIAGDPPIYSARTSADYDAGRLQANDWCNAHKGVPARYAQRTADTVRFECAVN